MEFNWFTFILGLIAGHLYARDRQFGFCARCRSRVRMNKPFFGDLHFCLEETRWPSDEDLKVQRKQ